MVSGVLRIIFRTKTVDLSASPPGICCEDNNVKKILVLDPPKDTFAMYPRGYLMFISIQSKDLTCPGTGRSRSFLSLDLESMDTVRSS